jgi:1-acyl-sn-glycerol-3-phosphate acyltransferase
MTMMLGGYIAAQEDPNRYVLVVPDDPRGAVLSVWARRLGAASAFPISMEADSMVAARRLLALIRQMKQGKNLLLNPDGPDGPSHEPKGGVVFIARKAGALIVPAAAFTATGFRIPRWDRYVVPLPFSRITVVLEEPLEVSPKADLEGARMVLRERLNAVERAAEELYRLSSGRSS